MNNILYSLTFNLDLIYFIEIIFVFVIIFLIKKYSLKELLHKMKIAKIIVLTVLFFASTITAVFRVTETVIVYKAYLSQNYKIVQGEVNKFDKGTSNGRHPESFYVNHIYFDYNESDSRTGYNKVKVCGGVITGNGQKLKIGYVYIPFGDKGNRIVYIEEIKD